MPSLRVLASDYVMKTYPASADTLYHRVSTPASLPLYARKLCPQYTCSVFGSHNFSTCPWKLCLYTHAWLPSSEGAQIVANLILAEKDPYSIIRDSLRTEEFIKGVRLEELLQTQRRYQQAGENRRRTTSSRSQKFGWIDILVWKQISSEASLTTNYISNS